MKRPLQEGVDRHFDHHSSSVKSSKCDGHGSPGDSSDTSVSIHSSFGIADDMFISTLPDLHGGLASTQMNSLSPPLRHFPSTDAGLQQDTSRKMATKGPQPTHPQDCWCISHPSQQDTTDYQYIWSGAKQC